MGITTVAKDVNLSFGLLNVIVSMTSAVDKLTTGNTMVCDSGHDVTPLKMERCCPTCDRQVPYDEVKKARKVGDKYVLVEAADLEAAAVDLPDPARLKKSASIDVHNAVDIDVQTSVGEKLYYLIPAAGSEAAYSTLYRLAAEHPEYAFLTQWTPRTKSSVFALRAFNGALCLQERVRASAIRTAPEVPTVPDTSLYQMAEALLRMDGVVKPFDPTLYEDPYEARLTEILNAKEGVTMAASPNEEATPVAAQANVADALRAMLDQAAPAAPAKPKRTRKAAS